MTSYEKGYTAAKKGQGATPPLTEPARGCYMDGFRDAERGANPDPQWVAHGADVDGKSL